ncbi:hypothetical protein HDU76_003160, partial [Blyttiomyces sp. JEL0837]
MSVIASPPPVDMNAAPTPSSTSSAAELLKLSSASSSSTSAQSNTTITNSTSETIAATSSTAAMTSHSNSCSLSVTPALSMSNLLEPSEDDRQQQQQPVKTHHPVPLIQSIAQAFKVTPKQHASLVVELLTAKIPLSSSLSPSPPVVSASASSSGTTSNLNVQQQQQQQGGVINSTGNTPTTTPRAPQPSPIIRPSGPVPFSSLSPMSPRTMTSKLSLVKEDSIGRRLELAVSRGSYEDPDVSSDSNSNAVVNAIVNGDGDESNDMEDVEEDEIQKAEIVVEDDDQVMNDDDGFFVSEGGLPKEAPRSVAFVDVQDHHVIHEQKPPVHRIAWSVASEKGYRNYIAVGNPQQTMRQGIHPELEDIHWPTVLDRVNFKNVAGDGGVDGNGGGGGIYGKSVAGEGEGVPSSSQGGVKGRKESGEADEDAMTDHGSRAGEEGDDEDEDEIEDVGMGDGTGNATNDMPMEAPGVRILSESTDGDELTTSTAKIFVLADGHGGVSAAKFFVPRARRAMQELMDSRLWDFDSDDDQNLFEQQAIETFRVMDAEYCATQVAAYRKWLDTGARHEERPMDDGCTLVVSVLYRGWFVNLNVGDSRSIVYSRPAGLTSFVVRSRDDVGGARVSGEEVRNGNNTNNNKPEDEDVVISRWDDQEDAAHHWVPIFASVDHNMTHPGKVYSIHRSGGHFLNPNGTLKAVHVESPDARNYRPYNELAGARIYRHPSDPVRAVGVSHKRTLNLTATMGDLLFKIEPAVLSPAPDVRFVRLEAGRDYSIVMATDGIWDHLVLQGDDRVQNDNVMKVVAAAIAS